MRPRPLPASLLLAAFVLPACATPMKTPPDFLYLKSAPDYRAVTADDARLWLRTFDDPDAGDLAFWAKTLRADFEERRGYRFVGEGDVTGASGDQGKWMEFATHAGGEDVGYLVAVFVLPGWLVFGQDLCVVEFCAPEPVFRARVDAVRDALATVDP